jgi:hypothetical protein
MTELQRWMELGWVLRCEVCLVATVFMLGLVGAAFTAGFLTCDLIARP